VDFAPLVAVIEREMAAQQVPGLAVAVIQNGVIRFSQGFGLADVAANREVTPATLFRIGSITKPLTAIALMQLVEAGQVDLDAPVVTYLHEFTVNDQITVRQLLSHSSGLGDAAIPYGRTDPSALADYVASLTPASAFAPPGTLFSYSNTGFNIVGRIIEVVSGLPYVDYMTTQLFPTLGMAQTTFQRDVAVAEGLALGYYPSRGAPQPVDRDPDNGAEYPSGFAFSNIEDLTRLALFLLSDGMLEGSQRLSPVSVQEMKTPVVGVEPLGLSYGLGLLIRMRVGATIIGHGGNINGYAATLELMPSEELAVIVLSNRNNYEPASITQAAFDLFVERPGSPPAQEILLDEAALNAYAGRYAMSSALPGEEVEGVTVAVQEGRLTASLPGVTFALRAVGNDLFDLYVPEMAKPVTQLAFLRDDSGEIQYMSFAMHALMKIE
jgi:CubicO group peptidase (beta-lactamase class C family)